MRRSIFAALLLFAAFPAGAQTVFRGPYLNHVTADAVTVIWESPAPTTGVVRYGVAALNQTASSNTPARHHEVRLTGLAALAAPGSELRYELEVDSTIYAGTFRTMPPAGTPFRFTVYGDNRSSPEQHQLVVDALLAEQPSSHFVINTGDLVSNGEDEGDWDLFFPVAAPYLRNIPLYVAIGNHEVDGTWDVTRRLFELPTQVAPASNNEGFYRVIYGNVELIVLNVEVDSLYTLDFLAGDQEEWLTAVLADRAPGVEHRFVFLHQGPYSSKVGRNGNFWLRQWLEDFDDADIDAIFSGHDHYAERGWAETGIWYVIHGGGGAPLYNTQGPRVTSDHTIVYGESRLGYLTVDIDGPKAHVALKGLAGEVVDEFTYGDAANPACTVAMDCGAPPANACPGGGWECHRSACQWACTAGSGSLIACATDNACETQIGANCPGTPECIHPSLNPLSWYCQCTLPPDCAVDADCQNRPSPIKGCTGTWACVEEQCEFTTKMCLPLGDAGVSPDAEVSSDAAEPDPDAGDLPAPDASTFADAAENADAEPQPARDAGVSGADAGSSGGSGDAGGGENCGCNTARSRSGENNSGILFGALLMAAALINSHHRRKRPN